jgi:hypothetical protein
MGNSFGSLLNRPGAATDGGAANAAEAIGPPPIVPTGAGAHQSNAPAAATGQLAGLPTKETGVLQRAFNAIGRGNPATSNGGFVLTSISDNRNTGSRETQRITSDTQWPTADTLTTLPVSNSPSLNKAVKSSGSCASAALLGIASASASATAAAEAARPPTTKQSIRDLFGTADGAALETAIGALVQAPIALPAEDVPVLLAALRAATSDVNGAGEALTALLANADGALKPTLGPPAIANGDANAGQLENVAPTDAALDTAYALRRSLAGSASGMDTLLRLQGLTLRPLQLDATARETIAHREDEHQVENYTLLLRAESALLNSGLEVTGPRTTQHICEAVRANPDVLREDNLGRGKVKPTRASGATAAREAFTENPMTLASQAFCYADQKVRGTETNDVERFKPAYVALRNGFTESGEGSDFNKMITRLAKLPVYVDRASADKGTWFQQFGQGVSDTFWAKNKSPLSSMMNAGLLDIDLATVKGQYRADFTKALDKAEAMLNAQVDAPLAGGDEKLQRVNHWREKFTESQNPFIQELDGTKTDIPGELKKWLGDGSLGSADPEMSRLLASLKGTGPVSDWAQLKNRFDEAPATERPALLREVMVRVANSGDIAEYSDARGQGGTVSGGASPFGVAAGPYLLGVAFVGEVGVEHSRAAALRAGVASNSGLLFLGTDEKWGGSLGAGVKAGIGFGGVGNFGGSGMLRGAGSQSTGTGVTIRTRKNGSEFETVALQAKEAPARTDEAKRPGNWKLMGTEVVDTLFKIAGDRAGAEVTPTQMWQKTVERLGDFRDVSFGWSDSSATTASATAQLEAGAGLGTGNTGLFNAFARIGAGITYKGGRLASGGTIATGQQSRSVTTSVTGGAGASYGSTYASTSPQGRALFPPNLQLSRESEFPIAGGKGFVRLTSDNGVVQPLVSFSERHFSNLANFNALVKDDQEAWVAAMSPEVDPNGAFPTAEAAREAGEKALREFLVEIDEQGNKTNRVFVERRSLKPETAKAITRCQAELQTLKAAQADDKKHGRAPSDDLAKAVARLEHTIVSTVNDAASWQPFRLFSNDVTAQTTTKSVFPGVALSQGTAAPLSLDSHTTSQQSLGISLAAKQAKTATGGRDLAMANVIQKTVNASDQPLATLDHIPPSSVAATGRPGDGPETSL